MTRFAVALGLAVALAVPQAALAAEKGKAAPAKAAADKPAPEKAAPAERKCPGCGAVLIGGVTSCPACGTEVGAAPEAPAAPVGLCSGEEKPLLSCELKKGGKTVSVCASKDFNLKDAVPTGTLAYRFGKAGKVELSCPEGAPDGRRAFSYKNESKQSGARVAAVSFEGKDGAVYTVYVRTMGQRIVAAGQLVTAKGKKKAVDSECQAVGETSLADAVDVSLSRDGFAESELDAVNALLKK